MRMIRLAALALLLPGVAMANYSGGGTSVPTTPAGTASPQIVGVQGAPGALPVTVTVTNPGGGAASASTATATQHAAVALTANADITLVAQNLTRRSLQVFLSGQGCTFYIGFDTAAVGGFGPPYIPAGTLTLEVPWGAVPPNNAIHLITANTGCNASYREYN